MGRGPGALALLLLVCCAVHTSEAQCITTFQAGLANASTETGFTILTAAIGAIAGSSSAGIFPSAGDGVTLLAPDDTAFTAALAAAGVNLTAAEQTLGAKVVSILLYHVLPQGAFTARELQAAGMVQTDLGTYLKESLPLTFATAGTGVNVSGVSGSALLGAPFSVCNSQVYPISTLLLPATTIAGVPDVLAAAAPGGSVEPPPATPPPPSSQPPPSTQPPPLSISTLVPTTVIAPGPSVSGLAPATAPSSGLAPPPPSGLAPAPASAPTPATAPAPSTAAVPAPAPTVSATTPIASAPALVGGLSGLALSPTNAPAPSGAEKGSMLSVAAVLSSAAAGALALLFL